MYKLVKRTVSVVETWVVKCENKTEAKEKIGRLDDDAYHMYWTDEINYGKESSFTYTTEELPDRDEITDKNILKGIRAIECQYETPDIPEKSPKKRKKRLQNKPKSGTMNALDIVNQLTEISDEKSKEKR